MLDLERERVRGWGMKTESQARGQEASGGLGRNQRRRRKTSRVETGDWGRGQIIQSLAGCVRDSRLYPETSGENVKALSMRGIRFTFRETTLGTMRRVTCSQWASGMEAVGVG